MAVDYILYVHVCVYLSCAPLFGAHDYSNAGNIGNYLLPTHYNVCINLEDGWYELGTSMNNVLS